MAPAGPPPTMQHEVCSTSRNSFGWVWKLEVVEGVFIMSLLCNFWYSPPNALEISTRTGPNTATTAHSWDTPFCPSVALHRIRRLLILGNVEPVSLLSRMPPSTSGTVPVMKLFETTKPIAWPRSSLDLDLRKPPSSQT